MAGKVHLRRSTQALLLGIDAKHQGGDSYAGTQALPVGKIIKTKVCRKDNPKVSQICIC